MVRVPRPTGAAVLKALHLKGDVDGFDNTLYFADEMREEATVAYIGSDKTEDASGLLYFLQRVFQDTPSRTVQIVASSPAETLVMPSERSLPLVIVTAETTAENIGKLKSYIRDGGTVVNVVAGLGNSRRLPAWLRSSRLTSRKRL